MMPTLLVAGSKIAITRVGFGCARIYGGSELRTSARLIEAALAVGVRHFDTAPSYGGGLSETVVGNVLAGVQDATITTKIGIRSLERVPAGYSARVLYRRLVRPVLSRLPRTKARLLRLIGSNGDAVLPDTHSARRRLSPDEVLRGLEESQQRLRRTFIDLYVLHEPEQFELTDELNEVFASLQRNGVIGAFGLAWGRTADTDVRFGTVVQGRYTRGLAVYGREGETRIFHGILRHDWARADERGKTQGAGRRIREVLDVHPDSAVIFSASTRSQIQQVVGER